MTRRRVVTTLLVLLLLAGVAGSVGVWFLFFSSTPPAAAELDDADDVVASPDAGSGTPPAAGDVSGTWVVDTSIGTFNDFSSSYAGFRVGEVLQGIGQTEAIGRTPDVRGSLTLADTALTAVAIEVDVTTITSDQSRRDPAIQRTLETTTHPTATFELSQPIELPSAPVDGATYELAAAGTMTIHGVSQPVAAELEARLVNGVIVVVGSVPFAFSDYGMSAPTAPIVLSVEDNGQIEFQLFFSRG